MKVDKLIEKHAWVATERQYFGKGGTDYDFASCNPLKTREELDKLQAEQSRCAELNKFCPKFFSFSFSYSPEQYHTYYLLII